MSRWTLAELVGIAGQVLASDDVRVASGRVTEVPNERLVRWYSTIGLVDRPTIGRGRLARYGERQLAQLVAVKHLQARGLPLVEIQQRLAGATDDELRRIAGLRADLTGFVSSIPHEDPGHELRLAAPTAVREAGTKPNAPQAVVSDGAGERRGLPAVPTAPGMAAEPASEAFWERRPSRRTEVAPNPVFGVSLSGLTLLLPAQPDSADFDAIATAAAPLIELLASRGLLGPKECPADDDRSAAGAAVRKES